MKTLPSILSAVALIATTCFASAKEETTDFFEDFLFEETLPELGPLSAGEELGEEDLFSLQTSKNENVLLLEDSSPFEIEEEANAISDILPEVMPWADETSKTDSFRETAFTPSLIPTAPKEKSTVIINFRQVFTGAPIIYSVLLLLSIASFSIWIQSFFSLQKQKSLSDEIVKQIKESLASKHFDEAMKMARNSPTILGKMLVSAILHRSEGLTAMLELTKSEGKRASVSMWQKMQLLSDVAVIAPMIGLLGTVVGMFYAFYDLGRSSESVMKLFDGLGISVGTTLAGLIVAILAMAFYSLTKFRLIKILNRAENEVHGIAPLIVDSSSKKQGEF